MKTSALAWWIYKARIWAGLAVLLGLALVQFSMVLRFDRNIGRVAAQAEPTNELTAPGNWAASW